LRGALTRAEIAQATHDTRTALRLYHRIIDESTYLITEALPKLVEIHSREGSLDELEGDLRTMLGKNPGMATDVAYTAIVNDIGGLVVIDECVEQYMLNEPTLGDFIDLQRMDQADKAEREAALTKVRSALSRLAAATPRYKCTECGFSSQRLLWQCPSCKNWETQRPFTRVQFDSLLQRSVAP
jgi:lipopolysaccharide biosynthesis regulator YciM